MKVSRTHTATPDLPLEIAAARFSALGSEQRLAVLRTLVKAGDAGLRIGELGDRTGITGSTLTHHVKILCAAGLATQRKEGRSMICAAAAFDDLRTLSEFLLRECCTAARPDACACAAPSEGGRPDG